MKKRLFLSLLSITLFGCNDSNDIKAVKQSKIYEIDDTLTIEQAFKTWNDCTNGRWDTLKDNRERNIVKYTCSLSEKYVTATESKVINRLREYQNHNHWQNSINFNKSQINTINKNRDELLHDLKNSFDSFTELYNEINEISRRLPKRTTFDTNIKQILHYSDVQDSCESLRFEIAGNYYIERKDADKDGLYDYCIRTLYPKVTKLKSILTSKDAQLSYNEIINKLDEITRKISEGEPLDYSYWEKNIKDEANFFINKHQTELNNYEDKSNQVKELAYKYEQKINFRDPQISFSWIVTDSYNIKPLEGEFSLINYDNKKISAKISEFKKMITIAYTDTKSDEVSINYVNQLSKMAGFNDIIKEMEKTGVILKVIAQS